MRPEKKDVCLLFSDRPKILENFVFFDIQFCIFKQKRDQPTDPHNFQAKRANKLLFF